jgi:hypothetical protein
MIILQVYEELHEEVQPGADRRHLPHPRQQRGQHGGQSASQMHTEMEFLDINLTKDSSLLLHPRQ